MKSYSVGSPIIIKELRAANSILPNMKIGRGFHESVVSKCLNPSVIALDSKSLIESKEDISSNDLCLEVTFSLMNTLTSPDQYVANTSTLSPNPSLIVSMQLAPVRYWPDKHRAIFGEPLPLELSGPLGRKVESMSLSLVCQVDYPSF